jgi:site-specific DNA-methyltransferase (adenine-specific)
MDFPYAGEFEHEDFSQSAVMVHAPYEEWILGVPDESIHVIITDPPFSVREFDEDNIKELENGNLVWQDFRRMDDGHVRAPQPVFHTLSVGQKDEIRDFFRDFSYNSSRILIPGAFVLMACHSSLLHLVLPSMEASLEYRYMIIRRVSTLRGGDKPRGFDDLCYQPRAQYEPWLLFRKAIPDGMTCIDCYQKYGTSMFGRESIHKPFMDLQQHGRMPAAEKDSSPHPNLKPQALMRTLVRCMLPFNDGIVLDPFSGGGSTIAACIYEGRRVIGIEKSKKFYDMAKDGVPRLSMSRPTGPDSPATWLKI